MGGETDHLLSAHRSARAGLKEHVHYHEHDHDHGGDMLKTCALPFLCQRRMKSIIMISLSQQNINITTLYNKYSKAVKHLITHL